MCGGTPHSKRDGTVTKPAPPAIESIKPATKKAKTQITMTVKETSILFSFVSFIFVDCNTNVIKEIFCCLFQEKKFYRHSRYRPRRPRELGLWRYGKEINTSSYQDTDDDCQNPI